MMKLIDVSAADRFLALYNHKTYWVRPAIGKRAEDVPPSTLYLLMRLEDGSCRLLLPLIGHDFKATLAGCPDGIRLEVLWDAPEEGEKDRPFEELCVDITGPDPYELSKRAAAIAAERTGTFHTREEKPRPAILDRLGWCTWDAFYTKVDESKVLDGLRSFADNGLPLGYMILDDGSWDTKGRFLRDMAFDKQKFPQGLRGLSRRAKEEFGLELFGLWHCFQGYWGGIDPDGPLAERYRAVENNADMHPWDGGSFQDNNMVHPEEIGRFYEDLYSMLEEEGIDLVKVDGQANLELMCKGKLPQASTMEAYQKGMQEAAGKHFDSRVIHCMSNSNEVAYRMERTNLWRNSDDFFPSRDKTPEGALRMQQDHLFVNALNAMWSSTFAWSDWDMFQTHGSAAWTHAAARALSGGPVYVCDIPWQQDVSLLRQLILPNGRLLKGQQPALPTRDSLFTDFLSEKKLLKVWNRTGDAWLLGLFHCCQQSEEVTDTFCLDDIPGLSEDCRYAVYVRTQRADGGPSGQVFTPERGERIEVTLTPGGCAIATVVPLEKGFGIFGLIDKMVPAAAVVSCRTEGDAYITELAAGGTIGIYSEKEPAAVRLVMDSEAKELAFGYEEGLVRVEVPETTGPITILIET